MTKAEIDFSNLDCYNVYVEGTKEPSYRKDFAPDRANVPSTRTRLPGRAQFVWRLVMACTNYAKSKRWRLPEAIAARFWSKVKIGNPNDCWIWQANIHRNGYGAFWDGERQVCAHRASYEINVGSIPEGMFVIHSCDNPACCNPAHLRLGTPLDNMQDMWAKGRARPTCLRAEEHPCAKLSWDSVHHIREIYRRGGTSQDKIATQFGVSQITISRVVRQYNWKGTESHD